MAQTPALFLQEGRTIDYTPDADVAAGQVVLVGNIPAIPSVPIAAGRKGALNIAGVFQVPKTSDTFALGDSVYWDADADPVSGTAGSGAADSTASGNYLMGVCIEAADADDAYVKTLLTAAQRTTSIGGSIQTDDISASDSTLTIGGYQAATGGTVTLSGGTSTGGGTAGGATTIVGGTGGAAGAGGAVIVTGGSPASGNAAGGAGTFSGGAGSGTGAGGAVTTKGGDSGTGATGNGGAWAGGGGAATSTNGTGGAASLTGGVATGTGTGGALTLRSGASAGASGTAGAVVVDAGAAAGGTGAAVEIGPSNATSVKIGGAASASERAAIKGVYTSGTVSVAVPSITDPDIAKVDVDVSAMTFAPAVGDLVVAIPLEALPSNARLQGAWVSATDTVQVVFGSEGGNVTGASKNFKFLFIDLT